MDRVLDLRDGRELAWREYGLPDAEPVLRVQGTPASRMSGWVFEPLWRELGLRVLMIDRPGFGGSTRLPGRGIAVILGDWDFAVEDINLPVVWWHGRHDANAPLPAVERLIARIPTVQLRLWESKGHLESLGRERELLRDLLSRT